MNTFKVEFPGLGIEGEKAFEISDTAFRIGTVNVSWFGLFMGVAIIAGLILCILDWKKKNGTTDDMIDYIIVAIPSAVVGARLFYVLFHLSDFGEDIGGIFKIWDGGLSLYGAFAAVFLGIFIMAYFKKQKFFKVAEIVSPYILLGIGIGRWGDLFSQTEYGKYTTVPWAMTSDVVKANETVVAEMKAQGVLGAATVHPLFLYESLWCLLGFGLLLLFSRKFSDKDGESFACMLSWYGLGRFFWELLKVDTVTLGGFNVSLIFSVVIFVIGIALFVDLRRKERVKKVQAVEQHSSSFSSVIAKVEKLNNEEDNKTDEK